MTGTGSDSELIETVYETIVDPQRWDDVAAAVRRRTGASASLLFSASRGGPPVYWHSANIDAAAFDAYSQEYAAKDVMVQELVASGHFQKGAVMRGSDYVPDDRFLRSEFYCDFWRAHGIFRVCCSVLENGNFPNPNVLLSVFRPPGKEDFSRNDLALMKELAPHLQRAVNLRLRLKAGGGDRASLARMLEHLPWAVFLVDERGVVVLANWAGEQMAGKGDGVRITAGRLCAALPGDDVRLRAAILRAVSSKDRTGTDLLLHRRSGHAPYMTAVVPLGDAAVSLFVASTGRAAVYVFDRTRWPEGAGERLRALFGLTGSEIRLAQDLLEGLSLPEAADRHGLSVETLRTQLKSLFAKTGTGRQTVLVSRLLNALGLPRSS